MPPAPVWPTTPITYDAGSLTVAQATLTITANNQSTSYGASGDTSLNAGYIHSALVSGDSIASVTPTTTDGTNNAGYFDATTGSSISPANATGTGLANYAITYDAGSLTVAQATLTITANNQSTSYGAASDNSLNAGYTHTALVSGDSIANVVHSRPLTAPTVLATSTPPPALPSHPPMPPAPVWPTTPSLTMPVRLTVSSGNVDHHRQQPEH